MISTAIFQGKPYNVCNGTYYKPTTPATMVTLLENLRHQGGRYVIEYGDPENGRCWDYEEYSGREVGRLGRTMGPVKSIILVHNSRSLGGGLVSTDKIVRIRHAAGKAVVYQHPNFHYTTKEFDAWRDRLCVLLGGLSNTVGGSPAQQHAYALSTNAFAESLFLEGVEPQEAVTAILASS